MTAETSSSPDIETTGFPQRSDDALRNAYESLRCELVRLQAADVQDGAAIDAVMARLDETQLHLKAAHGMKGNNPRGHAPIPSPDEE